MKVYRRKWVLFILMAFLTTEAVALAPKGQQSRRIKPRPSVVEHFVKTNEYLVEKIEGTIGKGTIGKGTIVEVSAAEVLRRRYLVERPQSQKEIAAELDVEDWEVRWAEHLGLTELWERVLGSQGKTMAQFIKEQISSPRLAELLSDDEKDLLRSEYLEEGKKGKYVKVRQEKTRMILLKILNSIGWQWQPSFFLKGPDSGRPFLGEDMSMTKEGMELFLAVELFLRSWGFHTAATPVPSVLVFQVAHHRQPVELDFVGRHGIDLWPKVFFYSLEGNWKIFEDFSTYHHPQLGHFREFTVTLFLNAQTLEMMQRKSGFQSVAESLSNYRSFQAFPSFSLWDRDDQVPPAKIEKNLHQSIEEARLALQWCDNFNRALAEQNMREIEKHIRELKAVEAPVIVTTLLMASANETLPSSVRQLTEETLVLRGAKGVDALWQILRRQDHHPFDFNEWRDTNAPRLWNDLVNKWWLPPDVAHLLGQESGVRVFQMTPGFAEWVTNNPTHPLMLKAAAARVLGKIRPVHPFTPFVLQHGSGPINHHQLQTFLEIKAASNNVIAQMNLESAL